METKEVDMSLRRSATAMRGLRQRRKRAGMTLIDAAAAVGVTRQTFFNWEIGASTPGPNLLYSLSVMFGCTVGALFDGEFEPEQLAMDEYDAREEDPDDGHADKG